MTDRIRIGTVSKWRSVLYINPTDDIPSGLYFGRIKDLKQGKVWEGVVESGIIGSTPALRFPVGAGGFEAGEQVAYRVRTLDALDRWFDSDESTGVRA